jgi:hypothetical protein
VVIDEALKVIFDVSDQLLIIKFLRKMLAT